MRHRHKRAVWRGYKVDKPIIRLAQLFFEHDHREHRRSRRHVARSHFHAVRRDHSRACVALACTQRNASFKVAVFVEQSRARSREKASVFARAQDLRQHVFELPRHFFDFRKIVELCNHRRVVIFRRRINREDARRVADTRNLFAREPPVNEAVKRGYERDIFDVRFFFEHRLIQMRDCPAFRNRVVEERRELFACLARNRVAPCAERGEQRIVFVERQVSVHHRAHAHCAELFERNAVFFANVPLHICVARLQSRKDFVHRIRPHAVHE